MDADKIDIIKTDNDSDYSGWADDVKNDKLKEPSNKRDTEDSLGASPEYKSIMDTSTLNQTLDNLSKIISQNPLAKDDNKIERIKKIINNDMASTVKTKKSSSKISLFTKTNNSNTTDEDMSVEDIAKIIVSNDMSKAEADSARDELTTTISYKQHELNTKMYSVLLRNDSFSKNITSMYYRKSLEYQFMHLMTSRMILDSNRLGFDKIENALKYIVKNTAMPEYVKTQTFEAIKGNARSRMADNILDTIGSTINKDDEEGGGKGGKGVSSKTQTLLMSVIGAKVIGALSKTEIGKHVIDRVKTVTDDPSSVLRGLARKLSGGKIGKTGKKTLSGLADLLGTDAIDVELESFSGGLKSTAAIDKQTLITQNEVVPGLLSKILSELVLIRTGSNDPESVDEVKFDYENREFSTTKKINDKVYSKLAKNITNLKKSNMDTDLSTLILSNSGMMYTSSDMNKLRVALLSYISSGGVFKNGVPNTEFYGFLDSNLVLMAKVGFYNLTATSNPDRDTNIDNIHFQYEKIKTELPNIASMIDKEVELGNTSALSEAGVIKKVNGKYSLDREKYLSLLEQREIEEERDIESNTDDTTNSTDKLYNTADRLGIVGKPIKGMMENRSINKYIDFLKQDISTNSDPSKTISVLKDNINIMFERLGVVNYIKKDLSPSELIEVFTLLDKEANDEDVRGRLLVYLHSKEIITDEALKEAILDNNYSNSDGSSIGNIKATLKGMADVSMIKSLKESRDANVDLSKKQEEKEDSRIEKIVSAVVDKMEKKKEEEAPTSKFRIGSWQSNSEGVKPTTIGAKADELAKNKPTSEGGGILGKILGILGMALPAVLSIFTGVSDKIGFIWDIVKGAGAFLTGMATNMVSGLLTGVGNIITGLGGLITSGFSMLSSGLGKMWDGAKSLLGFGDTPDIDIDADDKDKKDKDKDKKDKDGKKKTTKPGKGAKAVKMVGKVAKTAGKIVPGVGIAVGAAYAAKEFADSNYGLAAGEFISGLAGSIPVVGTAVSLGIDAGMDWYRSRNPKIDASLYNGSTYPNMDGDAADRLTLEHIRKHETGSASGKYDTVGDIGDGAGISFGAYQLTEKSGNLKEYVKRLVAVTNDPTGAEILENFEGNDYKGNRTGFERYLKETGATNAGKYVQDSMYKELFLDPAKQLAAQFGITDKASISQIIDHSVNAGLGGAKRMIQRAAGNYSPDNIARARKEDYNGIINSNASKAKYRNNWYSRVDSNASLFSNYKPDPNAPLTVTNNQGIVSTLAADIPTANNPSTVQADASKLVDPNNTSNTGNTAPASYVAPTQNTSATPNMVNPTDMKNLSTYQPTNQTQPAVAPVSNMKIDTSGLEKIMSDSLKYLEGINANTTRMVQSQSLILAELVKANAQSNKGTQPSPNANTNISKPQSFDSKVNVSKGQTVK